MQGNFTWCPKSGEYPGKDKLRMVQTSGDEVVGPVNGRDGGWFSQAQLAWRCRRGAMTVTGGMGVP